MILKRRILFVWTDQNISEVTYAKFFLRSKPFFSISHVYKCQKYFEPGVMKAWKHLLIEAVSTLQILICSWARSCCSWEQPSPICQHCPVLTCPSESSENQCDVKRPSRCHCVNIMLVRGRQVVNLEVQRSSELCTDYIFYRSFNIIETSCILGWINYSSGKVKSFTFFLNTLNLIVT